LGPGKNLLIIGLFHHRHIPMTAYRLLVALALAALCSSHLNAQEGVLDLTSLHNYADQAAPAYITRSNTPGDNPITDAGATLGRVLFYDKRLSRNNTISCSSCHQQAHAFGDTATASSGVAGTTGRHSMRLINARFAQELRCFWDERATSLEDQTTRPIQDHVEMGFSGTAGDPAFADLVVKLSAIPEHRVLFSQTFGSATITETLVQRAQFVRSIQSFDSRYDTGRAATGADGPPFANFTAAENNGKQLFLAPPGNGGAGCAGCHRPPEFDIDPNSRNNGVITAIGGGTDLTNTRSPSLRDLIAPGGQPNGGMLHDGSFATLAQVINHYNLIPADNANLDNRLRRPGGNVQNLNLTAQQRNDLAAFLRTLTGSAVYTEEKWSDPFNAAGELTLIILPPAATTIQNNNNGTATITTTAAAGLTYQIQSSTNLADWADAGTITADASGRLVHSVAIAPVAFYRFTYTP